MRLHQWARHQPNVTMYALAIAATLFTLRNRLARTAAAAVVVAAGVFLFAGTCEFRSSFTSGPFAGHIDDLSIRDATLTVIRNVALDVDADDLLDVYLSPAGTRLAYEHMPETNPYESNRLSAYSIEGMTSDFVTVEGLAFRFINETRWALVNVDPDGLLVEEMALDGSKRTVASGLPHLLGINFVVDGARGRWRLEGSESESSELVVVEGSIGSSETEILRFTYDDESTMGYGIVTADGKLLQTTYEVSDVQRRFDVLSTLPWLLYAQGSAMSMPTSLGIRTPGGAFKRLATVAKLVSCLERPPGDAVIYCIGYDSEYTELWSFASDEKHFEAMGALSGGFYQGDVISENEIVLRSWDSQVVVVRRNSKTAVRLLVPEGCGQEVRSYRTGRRGVFLSDLQNSMRLASQLEKRGLEFDFERDNEVHFLPSMLDDNVGVELELSFGDTLHGVAPVRWIARGHGSAKEIFPRGLVECRRQVSLDEHAGWLAGDR